MSPKDGFRDGRIPTPAVGSPLAAGPASGERPQVTVGALPFGSLTTREAAWLRHRLPLRRYAPNRLICRQGDRADDLYILLAGIVKVYRSWADGHDRTYSLLAAPAWFGEGGLLGEARRSASVAALSWSSVALLSRATFAEFERVHPHGAVKILRALGQGLLRRLHDTSLGSEQLIFQPARQRLAGTVVNLARHYGRREGGCVVIPMRLSHTTLGEMAGLTRETTCRVLNEWLGRGWVRQDRGVLLITALSALEDLAGSTG